MPMPCCALLRPRGRWPRREISVPRWLGEPREPALAAALLSDNASGRSDRSLSTPADRPDGRRIFPSQPNFFSFMAENQGFALTQRVLHLFQSDFDFQHLATICHGKAKYGVVLRRATRPE